MTTGFVVFVLLAATAVCAMCVAAMAAGMKALMPPPIPDFSQYKGPQGPFHVVEPGDTICLGAAGFRRVPQEPNNTPPNPR